MFLAAPLSSPESRTMFDDDLASMGFVMNLSSLWAYDPAAHHGLFEMIASTVHTAGLTFRQRGILVTAMAAALGDGYCALAWGNRLAGAASPEVAGTVLRGDHEALDDADRALARWAHKVVSDPNGTTAADVDQLRAAGFDDAQIFGITRFVALRLAFSTINDALGVRPDRELVEQAPPAVAAAVTYGRPPAE